MTTPGVELLRVAIGDGPRDIGAIPGDESMPLGPASFAVAANGEVFVLDRINARIQVFRDGAWQRTVSVKGAAYPRGYAYVDLDLLPRGGFVLLERGQAAELVTVVDAAGGEVREIPLPGEGFSRGAFPLGLQVQPDGIWVEVASRHSRHRVRIADAAGVPVGRRTVMPGTPSRDGTVEVTVEPEGSSPDAGVATFVGERGRIIGRARVFVQTAEEQIDHPWRVAPTGDAYQLAIEDRSVVVRRYRLEGFTAPTRSPPAPPPGARSFGTEVARATFGAGPSQVGVKLARNGELAEAPASFVVGPNGDVHVLDQVNARIQVFRDGAWLRSIPIGAEAYPATGGYVDLELTSGGGFALVDPARKRSAVVLDAGGAVAGEIALGASVPDAAWVTGLESRQDGLWAVVNSPRVWKTAGTPAEHPAAVFLTRVSEPDQTIRIADAAGAQVPPREARPCSGKPRRQGKGWMQSQKLGDTTAYVSTSPGGRDYTAHYERELLYVAEPFEDDEGNLSIAVRFADSQERGEDGGELTVLDPAGNVTRRTSLAPSKVFSLPRRERFKHWLRVMPDGTAYQLAVDDEGMSVRRYAP